MSNSKPLFVTILTVCTLLTGCRNNEEKVFIKVINIGSVIKQSGFISQENTHLTKVREILLSGKKMAEKNYASMTDEEARKASGADNLLLEKHWKQQKIQARAITLDNVYAEVNRYRIEHNITAIISTNAVVAIDNNADISTEIINRLKDKKIIYDALPNIKSAVVNTPQPKAE